MRNFLYIVLIATFLGASLPAFGQNAGRGGASGDSAGQAHTAGSDLELFRRQIERNQCDHITERRRHLLRTTPLDTLAVRYIEKGLKKAILDTVSVLDYFEYNRTIYTLDEQKLVLDTLYNAAKRYKSPELKLAADFMKGRLMSQDPLYSEKEHLAWFESVLKDAYRQGDPNMAAYILSDMWARCHHEGYARSFEYARRLAAALDLADDDYPYKGLQYIWPALSYNRFKDYGRAVHFFHKGLGYRDPSHELFAGNYLRAWKHLAEIHMMQGDLDSAAYYNRMIIGSPEAVSNFVAHTNFAIANLGRIEMMKGNYRDAINLMEAGLENMVHNHGDRDFIASLHNTLGECYLYVGNMERAGYHIGLALQDLPYLEQDQRERVLKEWYALRSKYYSALDDHELSRLYLDSALVSTVKHTELTGRHVILLGEQRLQQAEMDLKNLQIERQRNIIRSVMAGLILIAVALLFIIRLYRRRNAAYKALAHRAKEWAREDPGSACGHESAEIMDTGRGKAASSIGKLDQSNDTGSDVRTGRAAGYQANGTVENGKKEQPTAEDRRIMTLIEREMVESHAYHSAELTAETLADRLGIHRNALSRAINKSTGGNFSQYINGLRIKEAVRILSKNGRDRLYIEQIYEQVGFGNRNSFYRAFKQFTGLTPAEFQKNKENPDDQENL